MEGSFFCRPGMLAIDLHVLAEGKNRHQKKKKPIPTN